MNGESMGKWRASRWTTCGGRVAGAREARSSRNRWGSLHGPGGAGAGAGAACMGRGRGHEAGMHATCMPPACHLHPHLHALHATCLPCIPTCMPCMPPACPACHLHALHATCMPCMPNLQAPCQRAPPARTTDPMPPRPHTRPSVHPQSSNVTPGSRTSCAHTHARPAQPIAEPCQFQLEQWLPSSVLQRRGAWAPPGAAPGPLRA
jgi:hypothetical protein